MKTKNSQLGNATAMLTTPSPDPDKKHWLGFDLGGTKMQSVLFNSEYESLGRRRRKTKGHEGAKAGVERIVETIHQTLAEAQLTPESLSGIGLGCPGLIDLDRGVILDAANLGWKNVKLKDLLSDAFGCPVVILNDVDAGVYGEYCFGAAKGARSVAGIFPGTGIGGGFVYQGQILRGKTYSCLEIGHVQVLPNGRLCGCGRMGCLETEASRLAIAAEAAKAVFRGEAPHLLRIAGTDLAEIRSSQLAESIASGDVAIEKIVRRAAGFLGVAVAELVNLLLPEVIVLGGGLVEAMPNLMLKEVEKSAHEQMIPAFGKSLKIVCAKLGDDAGVRGAAAWIAKNVEQTAQSN
jgi:glucokinase